MIKIRFIFLLLPLLGCSHYQSAAFPSLPRKADVQESNPINQIEKQNIEHIMLMPPKEVTTPEPPKQETLPKQFLLNVPLIRQNPELRYGCEVTSLAMMLKFAGVNTTKMELYQRIKKDTDPIKRSRTGDIVRWGNPADGFVGDMTGRTAGYAVFDQPMEVLVNHYLPGRAVNLTNKSFDVLLQHVAKGYPVVVWTTGDYRLPDRWEAWYHGKQLIKTPLDLHAVVLVGYDQNSVFLNDPLSGRKQVKVNKQQFISSWQALQKRAISYK